MPDASLPRGETLHGVAARRAGHLDRQLLDPRVGRLSRHTAYAAAKGGLLSLVRQLTVQYGPEVRVNAVLPGATRTPVLAEVPQENLDAIAAATPLKRLGEPEDIAAVVAFLASPDAAYVTGQGIVVDGGWTVSPR